MLPGLTSWYLIIGADKESHTNGLTSVNIPTFTVKVVQSKKDLFDYALRSWHSEPVLSGWSKGGEARAQRVHHKAYMVTSPATGEETVSDGQTVIESGTVRICGFNLPIYIVLWRKPCGDASGGLRCQDFHGNERSGLCRLIAVWTSKFVDNSWDLREPTVRARRKRKLPSRAALDNQTRPR